MKATFETLLNKITKLENQKADGTITMENEVVLLKLIILAEKFISKK